MRKKQIAAFVQEVLESAAPMCAVGDDAYIFAAPDVPDHQFDRVSKAVKEYVRAMLLENTITVEEIFAFLLRVNLTRRNPRIQFTVSTIVQPR